jgi:hypothetical protein
VTFCLQRARRIEASVELAGDAHANRPADRHNPKALSTLVTLTHSASASFNGFRPGYQALDLRKTSAHEEDTLINRQLLVSICAGFSLTALVAADGAFVSTFSHLTTVASTVPGNGDVNPYGVAIVPVSSGALVKNSVLISNFNNSANLQGTGTTIVEISPNGSLTPFANLGAASLPGPCPGGVGLTTALVVLRSGWVIVGSLPTSDGTAATAQSGCLIVLDNTGLAVETLSGPEINGPWDMTALDMGASAVLFVSNVLNGTVAAGGGVVSQGSVLRIRLDTTTPMPMETSRKVIASAFEERTDPNALVIGPTGLGLGADGTLFVADTLQNRIAAIPSAVSRSMDALAGMTVAQGGGLKQPLGLVIAPNGDIVTVNGGNGHMVEVTTNGTQLSARFVDVSHMKGGAGTLFGLAIAPGGSGVYYVDDGNNTLNLLH